MEKFIQGKRAAAPGYPHLSTPIRVFSTPRLRLPRDFRGAKHRAKHFIHRV
jgi:hypothetical protein